mgnify:CR=1 FL=1
MQIELTPVEKMKAPEQIAERLLKYILGGGVSPGEKLPPERTLATQLNVTRATLREALKKLEQLKLIVIHQGKGIIVEDFHKASIDLIFSLLVINGQIDLKILENILEARELFGTDVARCAARRADKKDVEQMKILMNELIKATDPGKLQQLDFEFFRQLALASKNMVYILLMNTIKTIHDNHLDLFLPLSTNLDTTLQQEILQAVIDGDEEKAAEKANTFLKAQGKNVGKSLLEQDLLSEASRLLDKAEQKKVRLLLPVDVVITDEISADAAAAVVGVDEVPDDMMIVDIGPRTIDIYREEIDQAKTIIWNGPMGVYEYEQFARGSKEITRAMANASAVSVIGGGDSAVIAHDLMLEDKITHISTGGGATLEFLEGIKLPGIVACGD